MNKLILYALFFALLCSCSGNYEKDSYSDEMADYELEEESIPVTAQANDGTQVQSIEPNYLSNKKIIKDARIGLEVDDYMQFRSNLDSLIYKLNGYISNDNLSKNDYSLNCDLTIRISAANFVKLISNLETGSGKLLYKNISARDVTEEFIDIEARLKTKKEVEKRYTQLLSRARNIKEILEVEEKLRVIREEIESKEGRLKYLNSQVSFSTIYLQITQNFDYKYEPVKEKGFFQHLFKSLDKGWKGFLAFLIFFFRLWPLLIIGSFVFYYIRKIRRKKRQNKLNESTKK